MKFLGAVILLSVFTYLFSMMAQLLGGWTTAKIWLGSAALTGAIVLGVILLSAG